MWVFLNFHHQLTYNKNYFWYPNYSEIGPRQIKFDDRDFDKIPRFRNFA